MLFRLSEDGKTQVNLSLVRSVRAAPMANAVGGITGYVILAELQGAQGAPVTLKTFECKHELGADQAAQEKRAAQQALDYLAKLPTAVVLEGVRELLAIVTREMSAAHAREAKKLERAIRKAKPAAAAPR